MSYLKYILEKKIIAYKIIYNKNLIFLLKKEKENKAVVCVFIILYSDN